MGRARNSLTNANAYSASYSILALYKISEMSSLVDFLRPGLDLRLRHGLEGLDGQPEADVLRAELLLKEHVELVKTSGVS